ncbi:MAG: hypothetical protein ACREAA_03600 [Candidatus Polarisedimenticolia bacterium]
MTMRGLRRALALGLALATAWAGAVPARAGIPDCLADEVVLFVGGYVPPQSGLRVAELPGIVTGPPGDSLPVTGSTSTVSLGHGGTIVLAFTDNVIVDEPGPDFIVFENAFFKSFVPTDPNQAWTVFAEPGSVAVSQDGVTFVEFPYDPSALMHVGADATPGWALPLLRGLAGLTPTFTGNWTMPDDLQTWDPGGPGGVSGAGGDAFDLATVGLSSARYIRITDLGLATGFAGPAEGFDLDAVVALHAEPAPIGGAAGSDADGDGLSDLDEALWFGTDPLDADTDGDGAADGREAARCRSPLSASMAPWFVAEPDLWVVRDGGSADSHVIWTFLASSATYDVVRGTLAGPGPLPASVLCVEDNSFNLTTADHPDTQAPPPGQAFFYLVRRAGGSYGMGSSGTARSFTSGDCPP